MDKKILDTIFNFAGKRWGTPKISNYVTEGDFIRLGARVAADISKGKTKARKILRLAGQAGSGKSSVLMPAALEALAAAGINPVHLAVRDFAPHHPRYAQIKAEYGEENLRENTNAFAYTLLAYVLEKLVREGFYVLHEVTLCGSPFENFWAGLLCANGYKAEVHAIAMPKKVSDELIEQRTDGRKVSDISKDFFFKMMPVSLAILRDELPDGGLIIWSATEGKPVFAGKCSSPEAPTAFNKYRALSPYAPMDKAELLSARKAWFMDRLGI